MVPYHLFFLLVAHGKNPLQINRHLVRIGNAGGMELGLVPVLNGFLVFFNVFLENINMFLHRINMDQPRLFNQVSIQ